MSVTDYNDLKNRSEEIKNETVKSANTAERVGSLLEDINDTYNAELDNVDTLLDGKQDANSALDNVSGTNTGDETTNTIQSKRPLKTINGESLEGTGDITTPVTTDASDLTSGTLPDARLSSAVQSSLSLADSALQSVDKNDVGLSNVDNTSDLDKPVSTATQTEIDTKQDTLVSGTNIKTINNESILGGGNITISGANFPLEEVTQAEYDALTTAEKFDGTYYFIMPEIPSGYSVAIDQIEIDETNEDSVSFTFSSAEVISAYDYTFSTSGGSETVSGYGTISSTSEQITNIDLSTLSDGTITLTAYLTNAGGQGVDSTSSVVKDTAPPVVDLFPTGNAASAGAGEADSTSEWTASGGSTIVSVANTDTQGGSYAISVSSSATVSWRWSNISLTGLNLVPHIATIRMRRVSGTDTPCRLWSNVDSVDYTNINNAVAGATNGDWVEGTVTFTPTDSTVEMRYYSTSPSGEVDSEIEISEIIVTED